MKMLIVDDEAFARNAVIESIAWEEYGIRVQGVEDGQAALKHMEQEPADILMTDIRMPEMDGLMLLEELGKRNLHPGVIVLSSYNEFELVRGAMRLGALDYLFKPTMMPEDILETVLKVKKKIGESNNGTVKRPDKSMISDLLQGQYPSQGEMERFQEQLAYQEESEVFVISLRLIKFQESLQEIFCHEVKLMQFAVQNVLDEVIRGNFSCEVVPMSYKDYCVVGWCREKSGREQLVESVRESLLSAITFLKLYYHLVLTAGVSGFEKGFLKLSEQFYQAQEKNGSLEAEPICFTGESGVKSGMRSEIARSLHYIADHIGDKELTLAKVAGHISVSKNYFSRIFKETTGVSFVTYVTKLRMEQARNLYLNTELKIYEIAEMVGYSDWHYLYVNYKKMYGHSLSREKEQVKIGNSTILISGKPEECMIE